MHICLASICGSASTTSWPRSRSRATVFSTAFTASGSTGVPSGDAVEKPIRIVPGRDAAAT